MPHSTPKPAASNAKSAPNTPSRGDIRNQESSHRQAPRDDGERETGQGRTRKSTPGPKNPADRAEQDRKGRRP